MRDLTNQRFGRLVAIERARASGRAGWLCRCDCGETIAVVTGSLTAGRSKSCGCLQREQAAARASKDHRTHGLWRHPLYATWQTMRARCSNPTHSQYRYYGARGIAVCERWSGPSGFPNFLADMGEKPTAAHTLDRIDNAGPYAPDNCRWATPAEQARNRRPPQTNPTQEEAR